MLAALEQSESGIARHGASPAAHFRLLDLPREIIRLVCIHLYDPLELSQQDRLSESLLTASEPERGKACISDGDDGNEEVERVSIFP
jgi:hypothetical protein